ncbi:unnamed protein product [Rhodiola kirilowii]
MAVVFLHILISLASIALSDPRADILWRSCSEGHAKNTGNFRKAFYNISSGMEDEMRRNKLAYAEGGSTDEKVFVYAQCVDDLTDEDCSMCFAQIRTLLPGCLPSAGGRVYLDGCYIRVDNYDFYNDSRILDNFVGCGDTDFDNEDYISDVKEMLAGLKTNAPDNNGYAALQEAAVLPGVYGMANCWKNMNSNSCVSCLNAAYVTALKCLPSTEGRVVNTGCFLHYSNYKFANDVKVGTKKDAILVYASYILGAVAICLTVIGVGFCLGNTAYRHLLTQHKNPVPELDTDPSVQERTLQFLQFRYSTLQLATENFNEAHKIGQGGFGEVFKGTLKDGREFAIKRLFMNGKSRSEDIFTEMDIISKAEHKNLVRFLGCCFTDSESFIVYEYLANRSLDRILFDTVKKKDLDWKKRLGIITGTARGLEYLHTECQVRIVHRDIKASNILLDLKYKPKIADFGLARFSSCDNSLMTITIAGTLGYMAPEYLAQGRLTEKVDVYSFGVLVLEIVSGIQNNKFQAGCLDTLAWRQFQTKTSSTVIDSSLNIEEEEEIKRIIHIGLLCTQEVPNQRPAVGEVIEMLVQKHMELPYPGKPPFMMDSVASLSDSSKWHTARSITSGSERRKRPGKFHGISEGSARKSRHAPVRASLGSGNGGLGKSLVAGVGDRDGVIIVDHGSRRKESNLMLNEFVAMFRDRTGYEIVEPAHMELAEPSIQSAFTSCVQKGASRVIVSPFFLLPGRHWQQDIPSLAAEAAKEHPRVPYLVTAPLGLHELLVDVMDDRINHCLSHVAGEADECDVCLGTGKCQLRQTAEV